jgi:hypothetical protein
MTLFSHQDNALSHTYCNLKRKIRVNNLMRKINCVLFFVVENGCFWRGRRYKVLNLKQMGMSVRFVSQTTTINQYQSSARLAVNTNSNNVCDDVLWLNGIK